MARRKRPYRKKRFRKKLQKFIERESKALFVYVSMVAGTAVFARMVWYTSGLKSSDWVWFVIAASLLGLPKTFAKLQHCQDPYVICFAEAFRAGFLSLPLIVPKMSAWYHKIQQLWQIKDHYIDTSTEQKQDTVK